MEAEPRDPCGLEGFFGKAGLAQEVFIEKAG